ncbi:hypothetical protein DEDE109153_17730 [Deinococcus deserti]
MNDAMITRDALPGHQEWGSSRRQDCVRSRPSLCSKSPAPQLPYSARLHTLPSLRHFKQEGQPVCASSLFSVVLNDAYEWISSSAGYRAPAPVVMQTRVNP